MQENSALTFHTKTHPNVIVVLFSFVTFAALRSWWLPLPWVLEGEEEILFPALGALQLGIFCSDYLHFYHPHQVRFFHVFFIFLAGIMCILNIVYESSSGMIVLGMAFIGLAANFSYIPQPDDMQWDFYPFLLALAGCCTYILSALMYDSDGWKWVAVYSLFLLMIALFISFALNFERGASNDKLTVWGCIESMEQKVFWFFVMYAMMGAGDAVYFSLAAYIFKDQFDWGIIKTSIWMGLAHLLPYVIGIIMNAIDFRIEFYSDNWKARFLIFYSCYTVCIPLFYYAPEAIVTMLALQVLEISRVAVKECYRMALIKEVKFGLAKKVVSHWVYNVFFFFSCAFFVLFFTIDESLPWIFATCICCIALMLGFYDFFSSEALITSDGEIYGGDGEFSVKDDPFNVEEPRSARSIEGDTSSMTSHDSRKLVEYESFQKNF